MKNLKEIINAQQERIELERKANSIPYIEKRQVEIYKTLTEMGFNDERIYTDKHNGVIITLDKDMMIEINPGKTTFNNFITIENHNLNELSGEDLEIVIKSVKTIFDTIFKK